MKIKCGHTSKTMAVKGLISRLAHSWLFSPRGKLLHSQGNDASAKGMSPDFDLPGLLFVLHQQSTLRLCRLPLYAVLENTLRHPGHAVLLVLPLSLRRCPETYSLNAKSI